MFVPFLHTSDICVTEQSEVCLILVSYLDGGGGVDRGVIRTIQFLLHFIFAFICQ